MEREKGNSKKGIIISITAVNQSQKIKYKINICPPKSKS